MVFAVHQYELAISIYVSPSSLTSLPPPSLSYPERVGRFERVALKQTHYYM